MQNVESGKIYAYDVNDMISSCHIGTYTVEVLSVHNRHKPRNNFMFGECDYDDGSPINPLAECRSVQTGEEFSCDVGHLTSLDVCKNIYNALLEDEDLDGIYETIKEKKIKRLEKILSKYSNGDAFVSVKIKVPITQSDMNVMDAILNMCLQNDNKELFKKAASLKSRIKFCLCE